MQLKNNYWWFKSAIDEESCRQIINLGKAKIQEEKNKGNSIEAWTMGDTQKSAVVDGIPLNELPISDPSVIDEAKEQKTYVRDSEVAWLNDSWLYELFFPFIKRANMDAGWGWQWDCAETFQFTVYNQDGFYGWHGDGGSDHHAAYKRYIPGVTNIKLLKNGKLPEGYTSNSQHVGKVRKISMTVNLNDPDDYDGGDLKFDYGTHRLEGQYHICEEIRPRGSIIVFPSFINHCVTPVTRGTRYSLVLWTLGYPFK